VAPEPSNATGSLACPQPYSTEFLGIRRGEAGGLPAAFADHRAAADCVEPPASRPERCEDQRPVSTLITGSMTAHRVAGRRHVAANGSGHVDAAMAAGADDRIDQLDREMASHVLAQPRDPAAGVGAADPSVSGSLERAADHAVDIAEQAWILITGELRELD
jgi:phage-related tail fiber protein